MVLAGYTYKVIKNVKEAEEYVIRIYFVINSTTNFIMSSACGRARVLPLPFTVHATKLFK